MTAVAARDLERARQFAAGHKISKAPTRRRNCSRTQASTLSIAVPNDFMDVGPKTTRETLARAGYPLLSGEGVVRAIGPGRPDARAGSGGRRRQLPSRHGQIDDP